MFGAIHFNLQIVIQNTDVQISQISAPLYRQHRYSLRCISKPNIVAHLYWVSNLPDRATRDQLIPRLESFLKDLIAADDALYVQISAQLDGEDWSFSERHSIR